METVTAKSGEARKLLVKDKFDCIVLDLWLPDINGMKLLKHLRAQEKLKDIPELHRQGSGPQGTHDAGSLRPRYHY
ncbi:MAG: response regulator [Desulfobulbaceae bacterium]|jgi:CheY-like chemotaxis protein|nr:response regulator [Desulfobulbaceae bacterium]